ENRLIFQSDKKWLYPLFDFENFLIENNSYSPSELMVYDKIVGRAAALMFAYLNIKTVRTTTMSIRARQIFKHYKIDFECEQEVDKISCRTEEILQNEFNAGNAYRILKSRAGLL
ncbi:DUF1893 domain-containing protein, partial [candidate division KSB1 bacterium]|nr:DUF1893 domain-containing protein [candidate division KSB1 bacterium]